MSFPPYPKYKDRGIEWLGEVPEYWEVKPLKRACLVFPSNVDKKSYDDQLLVRLCNHTDFSYYKTISDDMDFMQATASRDQITKFTLRAGDTIITKDSETAGEGGELRISRQPRLKTVTLGYEVVLPKLWNREAGGRTENRIGGWGILKWWRRSGSNRRPPQCHCGALPIELRPHFKAKESNGGSRCGQPRKWFFIETDRKGVLSIKG
jgi:hypothetical protein